MMIRPRFTLSLIFKTREKNNCAIGRSVTMNVGIGETNENEKTKGEDLEEI